MMSGHRANQIYFNKKNKDWTSRTFALPHPPTSHNILFLPYPSSHPLQSGRHMCITFYSSSNISEKRIGKRNCIYKGRYEKLAVHIQWQKNWRVRASLSGAEIHFLKRVSCFEMNGVNYCQKMFKSFRIHSEVPENKG